MVRNDDPLSYSEAFNLIHEQHGEREAKHAANTDNVLVTIRHLGLASVGEDGRIQPAFALRKVFGD